MSIVRVLYKNLAEIKSWLIEKNRRCLVPIRKKEINRDFCIISNNCWGGKVYQRYGKSYSSPTIGLYFFATEYIKFLKDLDAYLEIPLKIIPTKDSRYYEILKTIGQENVIVGKLDDVEIVFLHYKNAQDAIEKWERRKKRIDKKNLIIKFSQMNECTDEHLKEFELLPYETKFAFTNHDVKELKTCIHIPGYDDKTHVIDDTSHYNDYIDIPKLINNHIVVSKNKN